MEETISKERVEKALLRSNYHIDEYGRECTKCREYKTWGNYGLNSASNTKHMTRCKGCITLYTKSISNIKKEYDKEYVANNYEKKQEQKKEYYKNNKEKINKKNNNYRLMNIDKINSQKRKYRSENREEINSKKRTQHSKNLRNKNRNKRRQEDLAYKLTDILRCRIYQALKNKDTVKYKTTMDLLGCTMEVFIAHIERQWEEGMTWENHTLDGWHIDHIIPCNSYDLTDQKQQKECFHYTNLQPLWAEDNLSKSDKLDWVKEA